MSTTLPAGAASATVDIALLLEDTYPYVSGDVSGWVDRMLRAFPQYRFAVVFIGTRRQHKGEMAYVLPDNVVHLETHYLYDAEPAAMAGSHDAEPQSLADVARLHELLRRGGREGTATVGAMMRELMDALGDDGPLSEHAFLHGREAWDMIVEQYRRYCTDPSFTDYFWTVRTMHQPLWRLARIAASLMPARVYHTASTGYAGLLGAMLRHRHDRPLLVTEHGMHTAERRIDLFQRQWSRDDRGVFERGQSQDLSRNLSRDITRDITRDISQIDYFRDLWVRFFDSLGRVCYDAADDIVALYEGNRRRQVLDGAPASRTRTIPTGVDLPVLASLRARRAAVVPPVLCLAGPVVPIKDVKTFIRAMLTVARRYPQAQGWIAGPADEDPEYARECRSLVQSLGLADNVKFLGDRRIDELLPEVGVLVLCSIGEALPLAVLEAFAAGVPCVTTDVGACRELIFGAGDEDMALGSAGAVVRVADPGALANEAVALLTDGERWRAAQRAAIARVERYYTEHAMVASYRQLYGHLAAKAHADGGGRAGRGGLGGRVGAGSRAGGARTGGTPSAVQAFGQSGAQSRCPFAGAY